MFYRLLSILAAATCAGALNLSLMFYSTGGIENITAQPIKKVNLDVYYESLCPDSIAFFKSELVPLMQQLNKYIELHVYPYGKAKTYDNNGTLTFKCQHGPNECYGNKLHACAIDLLKTDHPSWLSFTECLITHHSNDEAADQCAKELKTDSEPIKACAKSDKGSQLLKHYGEETAKITYTWIPHVVIDGTPMDPHRKVMGAVCDALKNSTTVCTEYFKKKV